MVGVAGPATVRKAEGSGVAPATRLRVVELRPAPGPQHQIMEQQRRRRELHRLPHRPRPSRTPGPLVEDLAGARTHRVGPRAAAHDQDRAVGQPGHARIPAAVRLQQIRQSLPARTLRPGLDPADCIAPRAEAFGRSARERLASIPMTAVTAGLGLLPPALALGEPGSEIRVPMALVILTGLATSTALNMVVVPALLAARRGDTTRGDDAWKNDLGVSHA